MSHWFASSLDELKRKTEILEGYCAEIGRDPAQIFKTLGAPVMLAENQREAASARLGVMTHAGVARSSADRRLRRPRDGMRTPAIVLPVQQRTDRCWMPWSAVSWSC